jgi:hypothetical protein
MDPVKIARVIDWPMPLTKKEVQSLSISTNNLSLASPTMCAHCVTSHIGPCTRDNDLPFQLEANDSGIATGTVLSKAEHESNSTCRSLGLSL